MSPEQTAHNKAMWDAISRGELNAAATAALLLIDSLAEASEKAEVHAALGLMLQRVGRIAEARDRFALAVELTVGAPRQQATHVADEAGARFLLGDLAGAARGAERARRLGDLQSNRFAACKAFDTLVAVALSEGRTSDALRLSRQGVALQTADSGNRGGGPLSHLYHGLALLELDRFADADVAFSEGLRNASSTGGSGHLTWYHCVRGLARYLAGDWDAALVDARAGVEHGERTGTLIARPIGWAVIALVESGRGNVTAASELVAPPTGALPATGLPGEDWLSMARATLAPDADAAYRVLVDAWLHTRRVPYFLSWRSLAPAIVHHATWLGHREMAGNVTSHAEAGANLSGGVASTVGAALRCRALLDDDPEVAVAAVEAFRGAGRPFALACACLDAGRLLRKSGYDDAAVGYVHEAAEIFHTLRAAPWLARAGQRLMDLPAPAPAANGRAATAPNWALLTPAEREVARQVARGLTNTEIGAALFISPRTVQTHTSHIYAKLKVSSRVQLASALHRHGLD